jgi:hypothetical protein
MKKLILLFILLLPACTTIGKWTDGTMAWADRTFPTYDDWFGDERPAPVQQGQVQRQPFPPEPVESQPISRQQEVYYDDSQRGHSFGE